MKEHIRSSRDKFVSWAVDTRTIPAGMETSSCKLIITLMDSLRLGNLGDAT